MQRGQGPSTHKEFGFAVMASVSVSHWAAAAIHHRCTRGDRHHEIHCRYGRGDSIFGVWRNQRILSAFTLFCLTEWSTGIRHCSVSYCDFHFHTRLNAAIANKLKSIHDLDIVLETHHLKMLNNKA